MKKTLFVSATLLGLCLCLFAGCGNDDEEKGKTNEPFECTASGALYHDSQQGWVIKDSTLTDSVHVYVIQKYTVSFPEDTTLFAEAKGLCQEVEQKGLTTLYHLDVESMEVSDHSLIAGAWKLYAFCNTDGTVEPVTGYEDCDKCFTLNFRESDDFFWGWTEVNSVSGTYHGNATTIEKLDNMIGTLIGEEGAADRYGDALFLIKSGKIENGQLKLFYSDHDYLLYNRKK